MRPYPNKKNEKVTRTFMEAHPRALHVLGNHDIDGGHSFDEVVKLWKMRAAITLKTFKA